MSVSPDLTRSASLSEKELKEARIRSQIIAAQLTIPSNSSSRGVQLFNRRKKRVEAFTLQSCGEGSEGDRTEDVKTNLSSVKLAWAQRSSEGKDTGLNLKNSTTKHHLPQRGRVPLGGHNTEDPSKEYEKGKNMEKHAMRETHFLPVKEEQEEEDKPGNKIQEELEVKDEITLGSNNADEEVATNRNHLGSVLPGKLLNGCRGTMESERASHSTSKQTSTIINRTARPFLSPLTVQSPEALEIPPPPSYATPPLPAFTTPQPVACSPPPPPPTNPLPTDANQPSETYYSNPPPVSPVTSPSTTLPSELPASFLSQYPAMPNYGLPTAAKPSTFVPQPVAEKKPIATIKTGILVEGAARRANKKSMFTFKEKPVASPNPELLALVQGVDERKKHGHKSVPEPASEEELLALGAEASNFLTKEEDKVEDASAPEWASCLKSSRTRPRAEHRPEQTLINVSGKGAELFTKRQSRMEKYIVEKESGQIRAPSPTASLPPSWVYPSNMPGRVKAMVKSSDMNVQISQNLEAQQAVKQIPRQKVKAPEPIPEPTPLEYESSKIERDLSGHRPYQLDSSLFILNPVKDPLSTLPRGAPKSKNLTSYPAFSRQASLPRNASSHLITQCASPQLPFKLIRGEAEQISDPASGPPRISSPMSAFPPEQMSSPRSRVQAPRPTFSAKKAGIAPQVWRPPLYHF